MSAYLEIGAAVLWIVAAAFEIVVRRCEHRLLRWLERHERKRATRRSK